MNSFSKVFAFAFVVLIIASLVMVPAAKVNADSSEPLTFSSGLTLYSPVNTTYSSNTLECNGTFVGPSEYEVSLNYSVDDKNDKSKSENLTETIHNYSRTGFR